MAQRLKAGEITDPKVAVAALRQIQQFGIQFTEVLNLYRPQYLAKIPGFNTFIDCLELAYNLPKVPVEDLKWIDIKPLLTTFSSPKIEVEVAKNTPALAISLKPYNQGASILKGSSNTYHAPLLVRDVSRWGDEKEGSLGIYEIRRRSGVEESQQILDEPINLSSIIQRIEAITDKTPVVKVVTFLPVAPSGEFETQFTPTIDLDIFGHKYYKLLTIQEDRLSSYQLLTAGKMSLDLKEAVYNPDDPKQPNLFDIKADAVPDLSSIDKLFLPKEQTGQMIIIAEPYADPTPKFNSFDFGNDRGYSKGGGSFMLGGGGGLRSASLSNARLSRGGQAGSGSLYDGELGSSRDGNPVIFHVQFICVKPGDLTSNALHHNLQNLNT
ncbi:MAG: hypothetical protein SFU25_07355 [Candidatus Caenarcaniphilales bacterium]|nr:hypothetical protein [Candidatus Caenarcaniphilales bacterium]